MLIIIAIISFVLGMGIIDGNMEEEFKHNFLMGFLGWVLAVIIPATIISIFYF